VARASAALRAAAKSSTQTKSNTRAPNSRAISRVRSVDPVSTTTISSNNPATDDRQFGKLACSSFTITVNDVVALRSGKFLATDETRIEYGSGNEFWNP
jgi:hypothetical protein